MCTPYNLHRQPCQPRACSPAGGRCQGRVHSEGSGRALIVFQISGHDGRCQPSARLHKDYGTRLHCNGLERQGHVRRDRLDQAGATTQPYRRQPLTLRHLLTPGRYRRRLLYVASPHASRVLSVPRRNRGPGSALVADLVAFMQIWALLLAAYSVAGLETRSEGRRRSGSAAAGSLLVHPSRCEHSFRPLNPN